MPRAKQAGNSAVRRTREPSAAPRTRMTRGSKGPKDDRLKVTVYLSKSINRQATSLARARQITMSAALNRLIERGLEYPDDESVRSIRDEIADLKDAQKASLSDSHSAHSVEIAELQRTTDQLLWAMVTVLVGRMRAGDFGASPEDRRFQKEEIDSLTQEYIQHHSPGTLNRLMRTRVRH